MTQQNKFSPRFVQQQAMLNSNEIISIPAGYAIESIFLEETAGHAITGGLDVGTTLGGTDVLSAGPVGANALIGVTYSLSWLKVIFSMTADTPLYWAAHTNWNGANIYVQVNMVRLTPTA